MTKVNPNTKVEYRDRFLPQKSNTDWTQVLFKEGVYLQGAELNEIQSVIINRLGSVINRLIPDTSLLAGGEVTEFVDQATGLLTVSLREAIVKYFSSLYKVPARDLVLQGSASSPGNYTIGVLLTRQYLSAVQDPRLYQENAAVQGFGTEGADREFWDVQWTFRINGEISPGFSQPIEIQDLDTNPDKFFFPVYNFPQRSSSVTGSRYDFRNYLNLVVNELHNSFTVEGLTVTSDGVSQLASTGGSNKFKYHDGEYIEFNVEGGIGYVSGKRVSVDSRQSIKLRRALDERFIERDRIDLLDKDAFPSKPAFVCLGLTLDATEPTLDSLVPTLDTDCDVYNKTINFSFRLGPIDFVLNDLNQPLYPNAAIVITVTTQQFELPSNNLVAKEVLRDLFLDVFNLLPNQSNPNVTYSAFDNQNNQLVLGVDFTENDVKEAVLQNFLIIGQNIVDVDVLGRAIPAIRIYSRKFGDLGRLQSLQFTTANNENITYTLDGTTDNFQGGLLRPIVPVNFRPLSQVKSVEIGNRVRKVLTRDVLTAIDDPGVNERITNITGVILVFDEFRNYRPGLDFNVTNDGRLSWASALNSPTPGEKYTIIYSTTKLLNAGNAKHLTAIETLTRNTSIKDHLVSQPRRNILEVIRVVSGNTLYRLGVDYYVNLDRTGITFLPNKGPANGATFDIEFSYADVYNPQDYIALDKYDFATRTIVKRVFGLYNPDLVKEDNFFTRSLDIRNGIELLNSQFYQLEQPVFVDYFYYLNREDLVYIDRDANIRVLQGKSEYQDYISPPIPSHVLPLATIQLPADGTPKDSIIRNFPNKSVTQSELRQLVNRVKEVEAQLIELTLRQRVTEEIPFSASLVDVNSDSFINLSNLDREDELIKNNPTSTLIPIVSLSSLELPIDLVLHDKSPDLVVDLERSFIDATSWLKVYTLPFNTYIAKQQLSVTTDTSVQNVKLANNISSVIITPSIDEWVDRQTNEDLIDQISNGWTNQTKLFTRQTQLINLIRWYQGEETDKLYFPWVDSNLEYPHASRDNWSDYLGINRSEFDNRRQSPFNLIDVITQDVSLMRPRRIEFKLKGFRPYESIRVRFAGYNLPCFPLGLSQAGLAPDSGFHLDAILLSVKPQGNSFNYSTLTKRASRAFSELEFGWQGTLASTCLLETQKPNKYILENYLKQTIQQVFGKPATDRAVQEITDGLLDDFSLITDSSGTVRADANGEATGYFHIPALLIPTGDKLVEFIGNESSYTRTQFYAFNHKNRILNSNRLKGTESIYQERLDKYTPVDVTSKNYPITWEYIDGQCKPVNSYLGQYQTEEACILDNPAPPSYIATTNYPIVTADSYQLPILQLTPNSRDFTFIKGMHEIYLNTNAKNIRQYNIKSVNVSPELITDTSKLQLRLVNTSDLTDKSSIKLVVFGEITTSFSNATEFSVNKPQSTTPYDLRIILEDKFDQEEYIFNFNLVPSYATQAKSKELQSATAKAVKFTPEDMYLFFSESALPNPIAYTFSVDRRTSLYSVKLAITKVPTDLSQRIRVEIRNTLVGFPGDKIFGYAELSAADVICIEPLTGEASQPELTEFVFSIEPIVLNPLDVYSIVVLATDPDFRVAVSDADNLDIFNSTSTVVNSLAILEDKNDPDKFFVSSSGTEWSLFFNRRLCYQLVACDFYGLEPGVIERFSGDDCLDLTKVVSSSNPSGFEGCLVLRGRPNINHSQIFVPALYNVFNKTNLTCQYTNRLSSCNANWLNIHYNRLNLFDTVYTTFAVRHLFYGRDGVAPVLAKESLIVATSLYSSPANYVTQNFVLNADLPFNNIRLSIDEFLPPGCTVNYSISLDNGLTWITADNSLGPNGEITSSIIDNDAKPVSSSIKNEFKQRVCSWELASDYIYDNTLRRRVGNLFTQLSGYAKQYKVRISANTINTSISPILRNLRIVAYDDVTSNRMLAQNEGTVKVDANDISSGFLAEKLRAGRGITITPVGSPLGTSPSFIEIKLTDLGLTEDIVITGNLNIGTDTIRPYVRVKGNYANILEDDGVGPVDNWIIDLSKSTIHKRVVTRSGSLRLPINPLGSGQLMILIIAQNCPTGAVTISWPPAFKWAGGQVPNLSPEPGAIDILEGIYEACQTECDPDGIWYVRLTRNFL